MALIFDADSLAYYAAAGAENRYYEAIGFSEEGDPVAHQRFDAKKEADAWAAQFPDSEIERCADPSPPPFAYHTLNARMARLREHCSLYTEGGEHVLLTGERNFRFQVATIKGYKANRTYPKPVLLPECREFLIHQYDAVVVDEREADDECAIIAHRNRAEGKGNDVIIGIDKDLDQIPGLHYNWQRETFYEVSALEGLRWFYRQLCTGDAGDNIPGVAGVGNANKLLDYLDLLSDEEEMYQFVLGLYAESYSSKFCTYQHMAPEAVLLENARLLWMQQWVGQLWVPPTHTDARGNRLWDRLGEF